MGLLPEEFSPLPPPPPPLPRPYFFLVYLLRVCPPESRPGQTCEIGGEALACPSQATPTIRCCRGCVLVCTTVSSDLRGYGRIFSPSSSACVLATWGFVAIVELGGGRECLTEAPTSAADVCIRARNNDGEPAIL